MEKSIKKAGFRSASDFFIKVAIPILIFTLILFFGLLLYFPLPLNLTYVIPLLGLGIIAVVPTIMIERQKTIINENIHLFITYAGTISTIDLDRTTFFKKITDNKDYQTISKLLEKVVHFAKGWNLGFAKTCRRIAKFSPSKIFSDFLDRFAAALDFGVPLEIFMKDEQDSVLDDYATTYKQNLHNIEMIKEAFIAITISIAFGLSTALLLPLLMGISIIVAIQWALLILIVIDLFLLVLVTNFIPGDNLCHSMKIKDEGTKKILFWFKLMFPLAVLLGFILFYLNIFNFLFNIAISLLPLLVVGFFASQEENLIFKRDKEFPAFIRALGSTIYARQGGILSSLEALQVHEFGVLQGMVDNLYTRLKIGSEKMKTWLYFAGETGSYLISKFINIFAESIYLGGHARKISEIISVNFQKILSLRKLRYQQASGLKGALYGSMLGFVATIYISTSITQLLTGMFTSSWSSDLNQGSVSSLITSIIPAMPEINVAALSTYLGLTVLVHAFVSALTIKIVDGGNKFAMLFDFIAMVWLGAISSWIIPMLALKMFAGTMGG